jgi:hypothetical protein
LSQVFGAPPKTLPYERLSADDLRRIRETLAHHGLRLHDTPEADQKLASLRKMYEPYIYSLGSYLNQTLPPWIPAKKVKDNWQTTAWGAAAEANNTTDAVVVDDHF